MKKILFLALLVIIPAMAFADLRIGAIGMYSGDPSSGTVGLQDFTFGAEARLHVLSILEGGLTVLYFPDSSYYSLAALADVGVGFDIAIVRVGVGAGLNFFVAPSDISATPASAGANLKATVDIALGRICVGLVGFYVLDSFADLNNAADVFSYPPWLGITLTYKLFK